MTAGSPYSFIYFLFIPLYNRPLRQFIREVVEEYPLRIFRPIGNLPHKDSQVSLHLSPFDQQR